MLFMNLTIRFIRSISNIANYNFLSVFQFGNVKNTNFKPDANSIQRPILEILNYAYFLFQRKGNSSNKNWLHKKITSILTPQVWLKVPKIDTKTPPNRAIEAYLLLFEDCLLNREVGTPPRLPCPVWRLARKR